MQTIEAILHCRGKLMEASPEEDYNHDKLLNYLHKKIKTLRPDDPSKPLHKLGLRLNNRGMSLGLAKPFGMQPQPRSV
jgi:hypothetical protein